MFRYYQKALKELEENRNEKHHHKQDLNHGNVEGSRNELSRESSHKRGNKRDKELRRKKKRRKESMETATKHDHVPDEVRKKTKKKKKRHLEFDVEATTSDDGESCKTQFQKSSIDPQIVSSNKESKKKRKQRDCLSEFSEEAVKKIKHSVQTTQSKKHRDREKCDEIDISCNQRTENMHTSVELSTLERSRQSYEISPTGSSSLQSNNHHSRKTSGGRKKKKKSKRTEDLTTNKSDLASGNYNETDSAIEAIVESSFTSNLTMDKAMLREATVISNIIHETSSLSKERSEALANQGIKVKKGKWSKQELELLKFNMARYLERNNLSNPANVLFPSLMEDANERLYWSRFAKDTELYKELGKCIQRDLQLIRKCAKRIFDKTNYVGRYSENEIKELKRLHSIHGNDWVAVGKMLDRSHMSVNRKFSKLPAKGKQLEGKWTTDEVKRLKEAVHIVTKTTGSDDQPVFHDISWSAVAELVKTRNSEKCRRKWLDKLCWSTPAEKRQKEWTNSHDLKLITRLYNSGVMEECDVDWMELKSEYESNYSPQWLRLKWTKLKKSVPNYQQLSFEDIVDHLYRDYVQTSQDEIETGTSNNES